MSPNDYNERFYQLVRRESFYAKRLSAMNEEICEAFLNISRFLIGEGYVSNAREVDNIVEALPEQALANMFDDETFAKSGRKSPSEVSKENGSSKSRANDSSKDMWYELKEELERIKKTVKSENPSSASIHKKNKSKIKVKDTEIEKELEFLKKKYRRF